VHLTDDGNTVVGLDVKYLVGAGSERQIDPCLCTPFETLERGGRKRRSREFLHKRAEDVLAQRNNNTNSTGNASPNVKRSKKDTTITQKKKRNSIGSGRVHQQQSSNEARGLPCDKEEIVEEQEKDEIGTEAAVEESQQRSTSTTFSTPQKKRPRSKPSKVTPIPSLVITDNDKHDTVSPMFPNTVVPGRDGHDDDDVHTRSKSSVVRKGLFEKLGQTSKQKNKHNQIQNEEGDLDRKPRAESSRGTGPITTSNSKGRSAAATTTMMTMKTSSPSVACSQQQQSRGFRQQPKDHVVARGGIDRITARKPIQSFSRTSKPSSNKKKPSPLPAAEGTSASGVAAASAPGSSASSTNNDRKAALKDVYEYELQKAREFMDQMVGPPASQLQHEEQLKTADDGGGHPPLSSTVAPVDNGQMMMKTKKNKGFIRTSR
jgi:hypothetical protein